MNKIRCEIYSRISGYFRPVNQWNKAKQEEFSDRKTADKNYILEAVINEVPNKKIQV